MIHHQITDEGICVVTFDRAGSSVNLFDRSALEALNAEVEYLAGGGGLIGAVFTSAKEKIFVAGADLKALVQIQDPAELDTFIKLGQAAFARITKLKIPTVAAIHGACLGGGYELALACDYRIATPDPATVIGLPEVTIGLIPAWGGSTRLPRLVGVAKALDLIVGGKVVPAREALEIGMIDQVVAREQLLPAAFKSIREGKPRRRLSAASRSAVNPLVGAAIEPHMRDKVLKKTHGHYPAALKAVEVVTHGGGGSSQKIAESLAREREAARELAMGPECRSLVRLFFLQERAKNLTTDSFPGLFPETSKDIPAPATKIDRVAVIGAGVMGSGIAHWLSTRGRHVVLRDIDPTRLGAGMRRVAALFEEGTKRRILTEREARTAMDRISPAAGEISLQRVDLIIEAAIERMEEKKKIFARLSEQAPAHAILATNTSALSISEIAAATQRPDRVVGMHFFNPVHRMKLMEIVVGSATSAATAAAAIKFAQSLGKLPILVKDRPGFLVNRVLMPYLIEAVRFFENGATIENIDEAMVDFGMPMGPLRLIDEVGADVAGEVASTIAAAFSDRLQVTEGIAGLTGNGWLGKKAGRGFYIYEEGEEPVVNPETASLKKGDSAAEFDKIQIARRLSLLMVSEAARCVEEGVVASAGDADLGMVFGVGFAPFRGGPLAHADQLGLPKVVEDLKRFTVAEGSHYGPCDLLKKNAKEGKKFHEF